MPRTNIPSRSKLCFSKRKNNSLCRSQRRTNVGNPNIDTQFMENHQAPVNNIVLFPNYQGTTINVIRKNRVQPYKNLLNKIKSKKRKDKQRLKKKQVVQGDVKPNIKKLGLNNSGNMPRVNKHIIYLSDSESDTKEDNDHKKANNSSLKSDDIANDELDDDVIYVETPAPEVIEIEDNIEETPSPKVRDDVSERASSPDDFLDKAHVNLKSKYDKETDRSLFAKPSPAPVDMSESGSISSMSDISVSVGLNVFPVIDFPKEKVNLFDEENLQKFRDAITPKKKQTSGSSKHKNTEDDNLPTLSDMTSDRHDNLQSSSDMTQESERSLPDTTPKRYERGRSIIKELVNDRAYVLLSNVQKKNKKKHKSKEEFSETLEERDNDESTKKKKKKKSKKTDTDEIDNESDNTLPNESETSKKKRERVENDQDTSLSDVSSSFKKSKKNKLEGNEILMDEENSGSKKKKAKKNVEVECESGTEYKEKKKKKSRDNSETSMEVDTLENQVEKKKKKSKRSIEDCSTEPLEIIPEEVEKKKKKIKRHSEVSESDVPVGEDEHMNIRNTEEKKTKRNKLPVELPAISEISSLDEQQIQKESDKQDNQSLNEEKKKKKKIKSIPLPDAVDENLDLGPREKYDIVEQTEHNTDEIKKKTKRNRERTDSVISYEKELTSEKDQHIEDQIEFKVKEEKTEDETVNSTEAPLNQSELNEIVDATNQKDDETDSVKDPAPVEEGNNGKTIEETSSIDVPVNIAEIANTSQMKSETEPVNEEEKTVNVENQEDSKNKSNKRKSETSISELADDIGGTGRIKLDIVNQSELVEENEVSAKIEKQNEDTQNDGASEETNREDNLSESDANKNSNVSIQDSHNSTSGTSMVVVDNDGNVDMQLTGVFTAAQTPCPDEVPFYKDVEVNNLFDNNPSWNINPTRFVSSNISLFGEGKESTVIIEDDPMPECMEPQSGQNEMVTSTVPEDPVAFTAQVKEEKDEDCVNQENVVVKKEFNSEEEPLTKALETSANPIRKELPNEIEEIVKEKDNLHTVKKLCEFLEEVDDPRDVLKKVSLLKQAFSEKQSEVPSELEDRNTSKAVVEITQDKDDDDDVLSMSSCGSSVIICEDFIPVIDITLANCDNSISEESGQDVANASISNGTVENVESDSAESNQLVCNPSKTLEIISSTPKKNDTVQVIHIEPKSIQNTESPSSKSANEPSTISQPSTSQQLHLDKHEVEDLQNLMSDDPALWKINSEDMFPIKVANKSKRCVLCREIGHLGYNCPNSTKKPKCYLCGTEGHLDFRCPNRLCVQCGRETSMMQSTCKRCKHFRNVTCTMCRNKGHPNDKCPDLWRRYHLTVDHGPLVGSSVLTLKDKEHLWCSVCAKSGHVENECDIAWRTSKTFQPLDPRIHSYEDIYKTNPGNDIVQPDVNVVPETSTNFSRYFDSPSASLSSSFDAASQKENTSIVTSTVKTEMEGEGLKDLPPEFKVIDQVYEDNIEETKSYIKKETKSYIIKETDFFVNASVACIREFLEKEIKDLETREFDICKFPPSKFNHYMRDDKLPKDEQKIGTKKKEKFFKELNMFLYRKKFKNKFGRVHMKYLKSFLIFTPDVLSAKQRHSLCNSYHHIFKNYPHDNINYTRLLQSLRDKYKNKKKSLISTRYH